MFNFISIENIARICHEANRAYCLALDQEPNPPWGFAPDWMRRSAIDGVTWRLSHMDAPPSAQHEQWLSDKLADGWIYGPVKDPVLKLHPCCVPYDQLPVHEKAKDALFIGIVKACCNG